MRRRPQAVMVPARPDPPSWVTHIVDGLRHIGSVDEAGNVCLSGVDRLYAARDEWLVANGYARGEEL